MKVVHPSLGYEAGAARPTSPVPEVARMNIHRNARLTPQGRALMVRRVVVEGWTLAVAAAAAGLSARQAYRWLAWHRAGGEPALHDRSSAPARCPHRTPAIVVQEIARLRRRHLSGLRIARALSMPVSTVGAVLRREGLGRLADLEPKPRIIRYQRQAPGELIHLDTKKLGRIDGIGHRFVARGPGMHRSRGSGGTISMSASTTPRASPTPRSCRMSARRASLRSCAALWLGSPGTVSSSSGS